MCVAGISGPVAPCPQELPAVHRERAWSSDSEDCGYVAAQIMVATPARAVHRSGIRRMGEASPGLSRRSWGRAAICAGLDRAGRERQRAYGRVDLSPDPAPGSGGVQEGSPTCGFMCT